MASSCQSRGCNKPSDGVGPLCRMSLCQDHLDKEHTKIKQKQAEFIEKLHLLADKDERQKLRKEQSSIEAEVQQVSDMFELLIDRVQGWKEKMVSRVRAAHDSVAGRLRDALEAEECEKELMNVSDAGDMRKVVELMSSADSWLDEARERSNEFHRVRSEIRERQNIEFGEIISGEVDVRCVGDVSAGVQQITHGMDKNMRDLMRQCWVDDEENSSNSLTRPGTKVLEGLPFMPCHVTCCSNTTGYFSDSSGFIFKADDSQSTAGRSPLPKRVIFVSFDDKSSANYIIVTSLDGAVRMKYQSTLDWRDYISGLHCDSKRQLLYVSQYLQVAVTDLSGSQKAVINSSSLAVSVKRITAIAGNSDLFALDRQNEKVLAISKDSYQLESVIGFDAFNYGAVDELAILEGKLLLIDYKAGRILKLCCISRQFITVYPNMSSSNDILKLPGVAAVDSNGFIYVSEDNGQAVRVFSADGKTCRILRVEVRRKSENSSHESALKWRFGLALLENDCNRWVVLANGRENQLVIFHVPQLF